MHGCEVCFKQARYKSVGAVLVPKGVPISAGQLVKGVGNGAHQFFCSWKGVPKIHVPAAYAPN